MPYLRSTSRPLALALLVVGGLLATGSHTVQPGETLTGIASSNGVRVSDLAEANGITDLDHIRVGQTLTIPGSESASGRHTVSRGETLAAIARKYGISIGTLVSANGIDNPDLLRSGTVLDVPGRARPASHTVTAGETLAAIARGNGISIASLVAANQLDDPDHIRVGQSLSIPGGTVAPAPAVPVPAAAPVPPTASPGAGATHQVGRGETLASIARRYGLSTAALAQANGIADPNLLRAGQVLSVPASAPATAAPAPTPARSTGGSTSTTGDLPAAIANDPEKAALVPVFDTWANAYGVPADLVKALAWVESGWNADARSDVGAIGIGQLLAPTAQFIADDLLNDPSLDPTDPRDNIRMTARWVRYLADRTLSDREAIAAYYQGLAAVQRHGVYATTLAYVDGVTAARQGF